MRHLLAKNPPIGIVYVSIVCFLVIVTTVPFTAHATAATSTTATRGLLIPLYIYPGSAWNTIIQQKEAHPSVPITVVINPASGPGTSQSSTYDSWIDKLTHAGITVIGYVPTHYAARSLSSVKSDIAKYKELYSINGIFLDEMSNKYGYESYYSSLSSYAHSNGYSLVVGNPGTAVPSTYLGTVDLLMVYEHSGLPTESRLEYVTMGQSPADFAVVSYGVSSISESNVDQLTKYVSYVYVTSGTLPGPYVKLPSYFDTLVGYVQTGSSAAAPTEHSITVKSVTSSGASVTGLRTLVYYKGTLVDKGFTTLSYTGPDGNPYKVCVENYRNLVFSHWDDGLTNPCRTFGLEKNLQLTATYTT